MRPVMLALGGLGVLLLGLAYVLRADLRGISATLERITADTPARVENHVMEQPSCVTRSKVVEDTTHTLTWCQQSGETWADFIARVNREWADYCASL